VLKAPGVYSALAAAQRENTGVRFRDVAGRFFPARRETCAAIFWLAQKNRFGDGRKCGDERIKSRKLLAQ
jgi:hypothetical protein